MPNALYNVLNNSRSSFDSFASGVDARQGMERNKLAQEGMRSDLDQRKRLNGLADEEKRYLEDLEESQLVLDSPNPKAVVAQRFKHLVSDPAALDAMSDDDLKGFVKQINDEARVKLAGLGKGPQKASPLSDVGRLRADAKNGFATPEDVENALRPKNDDWRERLTAQTDEAIRRENATRQPQEMTPYQREMLEIEREKLRTKNAPNDNPEATQQKLDSATNTLSAIRDVKEKIGWNTAGVGGQVIGKFAGTDAANMEADIDTIKANIGFDRLQMMRDASKTGGALGGIAVQELNLLQSTIASLNAKQSPAHLKKNLEKVEAQYEKSVNAYRKALGLPQDEGNGATGSWDVGATQEVGGFKVTRKK